VVFKLNKKRKIFIVGIFYMALRLLTTLVLCQKTSGSRIAGFYTEQALVLELKGVFDGFSKLLLS